MITLRNNQRTVTIDRSQCLKELTYLLEQLGYGDFDLSVKIVNNTAIQALNAHYRHKDKPTDVLTFPFHTVKAGKRIAVQDEEEKILGDIIISAPMVHADSIRLGCSFTHRLRVILVHSLCHLLGYTHDTDSSYRTMHKKERILLDALSKQFGD